MRNELLSVLGGLFSAVSNGGKRQGNVERRTIQIDSENYDYQIYVPPGAENQQNLPIIVFLHGIGERGTGGFVPTDGSYAAIVRHYLAQVPALILLPQCRPGKYWSDAAMDEMLMRQLAQTVEEFQADARRIYLIGVSMGGYGVWHFAARHAGRFAALVSICGGSSIMTGDRFSALAEKVGKTPAWLFHGAEDRIVSVTESRSIVKALESAGGNVKYSEYAGVGHHIWVNALAEKDLLAWLLAQHLEQISVK